MGSGTSTSDKVNKGNSEAEAFEMTEIRKMPIM